MELTQKYVFHIPLFKFANDELTAIDIGDVLNDLLDMLAQNGFENLYILKAKGFYRNRSYDELLITLYTTPDSKPLPNELFRQWFNANNHILQQEEFAWERNNGMHIEKLF